MPMINTLLHTKMDFGVIDKENNIIVDFGYDVLSKIGDKKLLKAVEMGKDKETTIIYSNNMEKIITMTEASISISDDYIEIYNDKEETIINNDGKIKTSKEIFTNNKLFAIRKNGKCGFEDKDGNIVIECKYDDVTEFNKFGYAGIKKDGKWGSIDQNGNAITEPKFDFGEGNTKPNFLGKYYKTYKENNDIYYTDAEANENTIINEGENL